MQRYVRPIGALGSAQSSTGTNIEVDGEKIMYFANIAATKFIVMSGESDSSSKTTQTLTNGEWYYCEIVVDLDDNSWTCYVDGTEVDTIKKDLTVANSMDPLPQLQGFYFYYSGANNTERDGLVDNLVMSYEPAGGADVSVISADYENGADGGQIDICFSEALNSSISEEDINIIKCGASDTITVSNVTVTHNKMTIEYSANLDAGCEYAVTFGDSVKTLKNEPVDDVAYVYRKLGTTDGSNAETIDFDGADVTTAEVKSGGGKTRYQVRSRAHYSIFHNDVSTVGADNAYVARVAYDDLSYTPDANDTNFALGAYNAGTYRILDLIDGNVGVEVYEFDYRSKMATTVKAYTDNVNKSSNTKTMVDITAGDVWNHIRIEYDTVNKQLSTYVNGNPQTNSPIAVSGFDVKPSISLAVANGAASRTEAHFAIDNYKSYVIVEPLEVEKVRYTDADGNVTGLNTISPETNKIDITFSEDVDADVANAITLTADGEALEFDAPDVSGNVVTLSIPGMLPGDKNIALTIPAVERVYNVKTTAGKFQISNLALTVNGTSVTVPGTTDAQGDSVVITADVLNTKAQEQKFVVLYAFYNDDELVDVNYSNITIDDNEYVKSISPSFTTNKNIEYDAVKAFIWDGLTTNTPLTIAASYPAE